MQTDEHCRVLTLKHNDSPFDVERWLVNFEHKQCHETAAHFVVNDILILNIVLVCIWGCCTVSSAVGVLLISLNMKAARLSATALLGLCLSEQWCIGHFLLSFYSVFYGAMLHPNFSPGGTLT